MIRVGPRSKPTWLRLFAPNHPGSFFVSKVIREKLKYKGPILFSEHHFSHAASAFYPSPFEKAAILTMDGVGEWDTLTLGYGDDTGIHILKKIQFPHSLGLLYSAFTYFCGFKVNSGEYKLMGLAPYGEPLYVNKIKKELINIRDDGSFKLNMKYFDYFDPLKMTNDKFSDLFGGSPRDKEKKITKREMDLANSIQTVTEEVILKLCRYLRKLSSMENLCLAGGVALNCVANGKILREKIFNKLWIQPAAGDAGGSLGCAYLATHNFFGMPRKMPLPNKDLQKGSYLGPKYRNSEIKAYLDDNNYHYHEINNDERAKIVAKEIFDGRIVGYMVGMMEFGPRALGARSILADARDPKIQSILNLKIKFRESFRPFAPSVLEERCNEYFELEGISPYMLLVAPVREERRIPMKETNFEKFVDIVNQKRSDVPGITHVDYSARIQTVNPTDKPDYYQVIKEFEKLSNYGIIVNTSFNVRGEPIICSPQDAYKCFMKTEMNTLVIENFLLFKKEQPQFSDESVRRRDMDSNKKQLKLLSNFFKKEIMKFHDKEVSKKTDTTNSTTYFKDRNQETLSKKDFKLPLDNESEIIKSLEKIWSDLPLRNLGKKLLKMASNFKIV